MTWDRSSYEQTMVELWTQEVSVGARLQQMPERTAHTVVVSEETAADIQAWKDDLTYWSVTGESASPWVSNSIFEVVTCPQLHLERRETVALLRGSTVELRLHSPHMKIGGSVVKILTSAMFDPEWSDEYRVANVFRELRPVMGDYFLPAHFLQGPPEAMITPDAYAYEELMPVDAIGIGEAIRALPRLLPRETVGAGCKSVSVNLGLSQS